MATTAHAQITIDTRIPSAAGDTLGIFIRITAPATPRYPTGAPAVIHVAGGFGSGGLGINSGNLVSLGFVEILFNFPGGGTGATQSGGIYDNRGRNCLRALADVARFAIGAIRDRNGLTLSQIVAPLVPRYDNVGLTGWSNGGNGTICVAGVHGHEFPSLAWIVNWESPVGDGMPTGEAGAVFQGQGSHTNPPVNPVYNDTIGVFDTTTIAFSDTLIITRPPNPIVRGGFYFDVNRNGRVDSNIDFVPYPIANLTPQGTKYYYSERVMREAVRRGIMPVPQPVHLPTLLQTEEFWRWRNGEYWIDSAKAKIPGLMFLVVAADSDHVQTAPDHPHVLIQYERFLSAGTRLTRLNPDRSYVEYVLGASAPAARDNPAFFPYDHLSIRNACEPSGNPNGIPTTVTAVAAMCELADRTFTNNVSPQLNNVLTPVWQTEFFPTDLVLEQNYPNPFNPTTVLSFGIRDLGFVSLKLYDLLGREVATLVNEAKQPGTYEATWDASGMPSGVYFARLGIRRSGPHEALELAQVRKLVLLK
jgi:hypothetical protein